MANVSGRTALLFVLVAGCSSAAETAVIEPSGPPDIAALCGTARPGSTPPASSSTREGSGPARWFSIRAFALGLDDMRTGARSPGAWACYGFDLDGVTTSGTSNSSDSSTSSAASSCKRASNAAASALRDGAGGIDNNFGHYVAPFLGAFDSCLTTPTVADAGYALVLRIDGDPSQDGANVRGALYLGRPRFVLAGEAKSFVEPTPIEPVVTFAEGYVSGGVWVSGAPSSAILELPLAIGLRTLPVESDRSTCPTPHELRLPLTSMQLTVRADGTNGVLAGILPMTRLRSSLKTWLGSNGYCSGTNLADTILRTVSTSADVLTDATARLDPHAYCDAISIGLGFTMTPLDAAPSLVEAGPAATSDCVF